MIGAARLLTALGLLAALSPAPAAAYTVDFGPNFSTRSVTADGCTISLSVGGHGPAVVLLHGYAEDSRMWKPLANKIVSRYTVIAPDLPGIGNSCIPSSGVSMTASARQIRDAVAALGYRNVRVVGHDIGLMVAYAYAALYPSEVHRLVLMDAFLPGVAGWLPIYNNPDEWHFRFYGPTPVALVRGRERLYFEHFWNDFAADRHRSIPEMYRKLYAAAYARPGRMAAAFGYFASFPQTADAFAKLSKTKLNIPVLSIGGRESLGIPLGNQVKLVAPDAHVVVVKDAGHWLMEEQPQQTMATLIAFLNGP